MNKFIVGQHVIANGCNIKNYQEFKGTISKLDLEHDTHMYRVKTRKPSSVHDLWFSTIRLDPDFEKENNLIAGIKPYMTSFDGVKVGTKLKVRDDLKEGNDFLIWVNDQMAEKAGKVVIVSDLIRGTKVKLERTSFNWAPDMFECIVTDTEDIADKLYTISKNEFVSAVEDEDICTAWKARLIGWVVDAGGYSFTIDQINQMKEDADSSQLELIDELFSELKKKEEITISELMAKCIIHFGSTTYSEEEYTDMIKSNNDRFYVTGAAANATYTVGMHFLLAHIDKSCDSRIGYTTPGFDDHWFSIDVTDEDEFKDFLRSLLSE